MNKQRLYILISSIIGVLAALMPWLSVTAFRSVTQTVSGTNGDGKITLVLFAIACALCFIGNKQEKFLPPFVYGLWAIGGVNILIFMMLFLRAGEASRATFGFGTVNLGHGAYLTFLAAVAIILFSVEQLQLVSKVDSLIQQLTNKKSAAPSEASVPVVPAQEEVIKVQEEAVQVQENVAVEVENVQEVVEQVVESAEEVVVQVEENVVDSVESQDTEEVVSENKKA